MEELEHIGYSRWVLIFVAAICLLMSQRTNAAVAIEKVAESNHQWTGIAVAADGRMFVNFPTWNDYPADYRVAELVDGKEIPYPSMEWNKEFVCVQSVVADDENHLWGYPVSNPYSRIAGQGIDGIPPRKSTIPWKTAKNMPFIDWTLMNNSTFPPRK